MQTFVLQETQKKDPPLPSGKKPGISSEDKGSAVPGEYEFDKMQSGDSKQNSTSAIGQANNSPDTKSTHQFCNVPVHAKTPAGIQKKLAVVTTEDEYEQEANSVAEKIVHINKVDPVQTSPLPGSLIRRKCATCGKEEEMEDEEKENEEDDEPATGKRIQRKCATCEEEEKRELQKQPGNTPPFATHSVHNVLQATGQPLDGETRTYMEQRFGFDFSKVQIHNSSLAHRSAKDINALAYTYRHNIVFGAGQYQPHTEPGKKLLAHELTHVVQQGNENMVRRAAAINFDLTEEVAEVPSKDEAVEEKSSGDDNEMSKEEAKFIVEDGTETGKGQMQKTAFLEALNKAVCETVDEALKGTEYSSDNCPYIRAAFAKHKDSTPLYIEQLIDRYSQIVSKAKNAHDLIRLMQVRVMSAVMAWLKTGDMSEVPGDIQSELYASMGAAVKSKIKEAASRAVRFKAKAGGAHVVESPGEVLQNLGKGDKIDTTTRSRMEQAFGTDFSGVEIHSDNSAAAITSEMNARAFSVGEHIAFGSGERKPGTLAGDVLLAHELAHVIQQRQSSASEPQQSPGNEVAYEKDANRSTVSVMMRMLQKANGWMGMVLPGMRSGLAIQRCGRTEMDQAELDRLKPILEKSLTVMNGIDPAIVNNRFNYSFKGSKEGELSTYWLQNSFSTKVLKYPDGKKIEWEQDTMVVSAGGYAATSDARPLLTGEGQYTFTINLKVVGDDNSSIGLITLSKTFNVESVRKRSIGAFNKIENESFEKYKSGIIEQSALLSPDNTPVNSTDPHITSTGANPAPSSSADSPSSLSFQVVNDSPGKEYQWYVRPIGWTGMPDNVGSYHTVDKDGIKFYDLGSNSTANWPTTHPNIYVVVCKRFERIGNGEKRQLKDLVYLQTVLTKEGLKELEEFRKYTERVESASSKIKGEIVQVKAVHVSEESGQVVPLKLFAGRSAEGEGYVLLDLTPGLDPSEFKLEFHGRNTDELKNDFRSYNKYPKGEINIEFPPNNIGLEVKGWYLETTGITIWTALSGGLGVLSFLLAVGAIAAAPFTEGGSLVVGGLLIGSAVTGVAAGAFSIIDNLKNEQLSKTRMAIDIAGIVASMIGGAAAFRAARAGGNAVLLANTTTRYLLMGNFGLAAVSTFLISIDGVAQIDKILSNNKIPTEQKVAAITRIVATLIVTGAMLYLAHKDMKAIGVKINSVFGETLGSSLKDEEKFLLVLLDENTLANLKVANVGKEELSSLANAIREDQSFIQRAAKNREVLPQALKNAEGGTLAELEKSIANLGDPNFATLGGRVKKPAGFVNKAKTFGSNTDVPGRYASDPRFSSLASDPAHLNPDGTGKISSASRQEAMAGLEAESQGAIKGPIERGPKEIEFFDANGSPLDVKAPPSRSTLVPVDMNYETVGASIKKELSGKPLWPNKKTGVPEKRRVILDATYMNEADHKGLWEWLNKNLAPEELARIIEVNVKL